MKRKPQAPEKLVRKLAAEEWARAGHEGPLPECFFLAVRPYWPKSMGPTPGNDVNIYDDAIFFCWGRGMRAQQANTDPSRYGWNANADKPMAVLQPGVWFVRRGPHKGRTPAFRQFDVDEGRKHGVPNDGRMLVTRTYAPGDPRNYQESGYYAINLHLGGVYGTSSEGCQTVPREDEAFLQHGWDETEAADQYVIPYILIDGPIH